MRVWTVSEQKAGTLTQVVGVAEQLDPSPLVRRIDRLPRWRKGLLSPYRFDRQAEPDVVISCGIFAERHVAAIRSKFGGRPLTVHLQPPAADAVGVYDLAFVSRHDLTRSRLPGTSYHEMIGVPHRVRGERLAETREPARNHLAIAAADKVATVLVGGSNGAYNYDAETIERLVTAVAGLSAAGYRVLVSTSRRSEPALLARLLALTGERITVWDRIGENPYQDYLAAADMFVVTKDTVTMQCEALASQRPVFVFDLSKALGAKLDKFEWFHRDMSATLGLTRPFNLPLTPYQYHLADQATVIAETIRTAFAERGRAR